MSKFFNLTKIKHEFRKRSIFNRIKMNIKLWNILVVVLIFFVGFVYLLEVNNRATKGFKVKELEQKIEKLKETGERLELETASLQSMSKIQEKIQDLNMVSVAKTDYISSSSSFAAK